MKSVIPVGADFWCPRYGICTKAQLQMVLASAGPIHLPGVSTGITDAWAEVAWTGPFSGPGVAAQTVATAEGFPQPPDSSTTSILNSIIPGVLNALGEQNMAGLIIPNTFQVSIQATSGGVAVDNVIGVSKTGGTAQGAAEAVQTSWEASDGPISELNEQYTMVQYKAVDLSSSLGDIYELPSTATGVGSGQLATAAACALVKWNGGTRSRSSRGRLYFGPIGEGAVNADGRTIDGTVLGQIADAFTAFRSSLAFLGYPLVVISRTLETTFPVTEQLVEETIATQRRRIRG